MKRILIVDDNIDFLHILSNSLNQQFEIYEATGVDEALNLLKEISVDLICSDLHMVDGTGLDLLQTLRQKNFKTPFILISGNKDCHVIRIAQNYGAVFYDKADPYLLSEIKSMASFNS